MGHTQLLCERIKKNVPQIQHIEVESTHDFKLYKHEDADIIITPVVLSERDRRIVNISNLLSETGISTLRTHMDKLNLKVHEDHNPFSPICFPLFSPDIVFMHVKVKDKDEILRYMAEQMEHKGFVTKQFYQSVMERESATTTSIGNGVSLPHGAQSEVIDSKVAIAILEEGILWDDDVVDVVFLLGFKMTTPDETKRIQEFYKQYISLVETDEKIKTLKGMKSNVELYKYLIQ